MTKNRLAQTVKRRSIGTHFAHFRRIKMKFKQKRLTGAPARLLAVLLVLSGGLVSAFAQAETGQIIVRVTDPEGAVIPGASVTIKSAGIGFSQTGRRVKKGSRSLPA